MGTEPTARDRSGPYRPISGDRSALRWGPISIVVILAVLASALALGVWFGQFSPPSPPGLGVSSGTSAAIPGAPGCRSAPGDLCFRVGVVTTYHGVAYSALHFAITQPVNSTRPLWGSVPLPAGATVSVLVGTRVVGIWNFSSHAWSLAPSGVLPYDQNVPVILDTGLVSNSTLRSAYLDVDLSGPEDGGIGFPLGYVP